VDDSSGVNIQCVINHPTEKPANLNQARGISDADSLERTREALRTRGPPSLDPALFPAGVAIGMVIDIKGGIRIFRDQKQIEAQKIVILRSTGQEVDFWSKIIQLRSDILSKPWVLSEEEVRRCRRDAEKDIEGLRKTDKERKKKKDPGNVLRRAAIQNLRNQHRDKGDRVSPPPRRVKKITGLEKRTKRPKTRLPADIEGDYDPRGL